MRNLLEFLAKYNYWLTFLALEIVSLVLFFRFNHYQGSVWFTSANSAAGQVLEWKAEATAYCNLAQVNADLTRNNLLLEYNLDIMRRNLQVARHDSTLTELRQSRLLQGFDMIPARVVNNSVRHADNYLTLDKGSLDGVRPEMGVVCGQGIVGIVYLTSPHYSVVMPVLNGKSSISCRLRGSDYFGYLQWRGGNSLYAVLTDVPRHARFKMGDAVETSGFSAVFPAGLFVGKISRILNSEDGLSYELEVHLSTDFARLRDVCILSSGGHDEIQALEAQINSKKKDK